MTPRSWAWWPLAAAVLSCGCAGDSPRGLPAAPDTAAQTVAVSPAPGPGVPGLLLSTAAARGLQLSDAMALAVADDPDLKAARQKAGVAGAQLFAAGLPPDPKLTAGVGRGPEFTGFSLGVSESLRAFVVRPALASSARSRRRQVDLDILWQEWRTAVAAGRLFIRAREDADLQEVVARSRKLLAQQYALDQADFHQSAGSVRKVAGDLTVLSDADARLRQVELDGDAARHRLNFVLGLAPEAQPVLLASSGAVSRPLPEADFQAARASLAGRRVDLLALQAGYESSQQRLRAAALARFPAPDVGLDWSQDPAEGVHTVGLTLGVALPVFNGGRGRAAVERASREALRAAYQARLDQADSQADQLWRATGILAKQLDRLRAQTSALQALARVAGQQFRSGEMDTGAYVGLETSLLKDEEESIRLRAALDSDLLELRALLGLPLLAR